MIVFRERVLPSWPNLALPALLLPSVYAVMLPIDRFLALPIAALCTLAFVGIIFSSAPMLELTEESFTARGATIDLKLLGKAEVIEREDIFAELGTNLDARAWLSIQASIKGMVKVEVLDPQDPTPYWLISTRKPEHLAKLLNR